MNIPVKDGMIVIVERNAVVTAMATQAALETASLFVLKMNNPVHGAMNETHHMAHGNTADFIVLNVAFCVVRPLAR